MTTDVVWVSPSARIKTAVILMKGHHIGALPVVGASDEVMGIVTYQHILGEPQDTAVMDVMSRDYTPVEPEMSAYDAAEVMVGAKSDYLLVMDGPRLAGIISHGDLMPELGKTFDPLTGLAWADQFREWAMSALKGGHEISIIFFDLDKYGQFNKKWGHVVGDNVIKSVAEVIKNGTNSDSDFVCRYAGDEFAIVSTRNADEAQELAHFLKEGISRIKIQDVPESVSVSYGIFGGRRTKEREDIHYAATIDDLITRASKNCTLNKPHRVEKPETAPAAQPMAPREPISSPYLTPVGRSARLKIRTINFSSTGSEATVGVTLERSGRVYAREASGYVIEGTNMLRLVAEATASAASNALASEHGVVVDEVLLQTGMKGEQIVTVIAVFLTPRFTVRSSGSAIIKRGDQFRAAAAAVLNAINRQFEVSPLSEPEAPETQPSTSPLQ